MRAIRRHHRERLKNKRKNYYGMNNPVLIEWLGIGWLEKTRAKIVDTPTSCSCFMCGNPRKHWKQKTLKEKLFKDELDEMP